MRWILLTATVALSGCNVVPPLDCLAGAQRSGCTRAADGRYGYLYAPPGSGAPVIMQPDPPLLVNSHPERLFARPRPLNTDCIRVGDNMVSCTTQ